MSENDKCPVCERTLPVGELKVIGYTQVGRGEPFAVCRACRHPQAVAHVRRDHAIARKDEEWFAEQARRARRRRAKEQTRDLSVVLVGLKEDQPDHVRRFFDERCFGGTLVSRGVKGLFSFVRRHPESVVFVMTDGVPPKKMERLRWLNLVEVSGGLESLMDSIDEWLHRHLMDKEKEV